MSHHKHLVFTGDDFPQGVGLHTGLHTGILLHLLAFTAVVSDTFRGLDNGLVTAPPQRQIYGIAGKFIILGIGESVQTHTDADGYCHLIADVDRLDLLQKVKTGFLQLGYHALAHNQQILVFLQLFADSVKSRNIFVDFSVYQCNQQGPADLFHAIQRLVIIVQVNHPHGQTLVIHLSQRNPQRGLVIEVYGNQIAIVRRTVNHVAVFRHLLQGNLPELCHILISLIFQFILRFIHTAVLRQPVPGDGRKKGSNRFFVTLSLVDYGFKSNVGPDHLTVVVQQRIRQIQLPQQLLLDLPVLRGKTDQFIHNQGFIIKIQRQCNGKIKQNVSCQKRACPVIDHKHGNVHNAAEHAQINTKLYICLNASL